MVGGSKSRKTSGRTVRKKKVCSGSVRDKYLQKTYQITLQDYERLLTAFTGGCWVCGTLPKPGKNLAVEHDHKLAKEVGVRKSIRGLACFYCNKRRIGRSRRCHSYLYRRVADYLESNKAQEILGENG